MKSADDVSQFYELPMLFGDFLLKASCRLAYPEDDIVDY